MTTSECSFSASCRYDVRVRKPWGLSKQEPDSAINLLTSLPDDTAVQITNFLNSDMHMVNAFLGLVSVGGTAKTDKVAKLLEANPIDIQYGFDALRKLGMVTISPTGTWHLSDTGREIAVKYRLTQHLPHTNSV